MSSDEAALAPAASGAPEAVHSRAEPHGSFDVNGNEVPAESQYSVAASALHMSHKQQLGLGGLVCLIFFEVCGGPFGSEEAVEAGGPLLALLGYAVLPFVWSIPEALVCAELATAFPENSGYVVWVEAAFGPFSGFLEGLFSWLSGVTDNTIYPVMLITYLQTFFPALEGFWLQKTVLITSSAAMIYLNWRGLDIVGRSAEIITVATMAPFALLAILAIPHMEPSNWLRSKPLAEVDWIGYFNIMFWCLNSWDSVSTLAGEVSDPGRMLPKALLLGVQLVIASYLIPLMVGTAVTPALDGDWKLGYFGHVAQIVGGRWLAIVLVMSAAVAQVGMFEAEMSSDSYQVLGMAQRGYLPRAFTARSRHGTPVVGIALSSLGVVSMLVFSFSQIIQMLNAVYCLAELLEFAAFIHLRVKRPDLRRVFRVPLPTWGLVLMLLPASLLLLTVLALPVLQHQWVIVLYTFGVLLLGFALYAVLQLLRRCRVVAFVHNPEVTMGRWSAGALAASLTAFPTFLLAVAIYAYVRLDVGAAVACAIGAGCVIGAAVWGCVQLALRLEADRLGSRDLGERYSTHLLSIPEAGQEAPLMRAFLRDSIVHNDSAEWNFAHGR